MNRPRNKVESACLLPIFFQRQRFTMTSQELASCSFETWSTSQVAKLFLSSHSSNCLSIFSFLREKILGFVEFLVRLT